MSTESRKSDPNSVSLKEFILAQFNSIEDQIDGLRLDISKSNTDLTNKINVVSLKLDKKIEEYDKKITDIEKSQSAAAILQTTLTLVITAVGGVVGFFWKK